MTRALFNRSSFRLWLIGLAFLAFIPILVFGRTAEPYNGFQVEPHAVPLKDILSGGPQRDGIPALLNPHVIPVDRVDFLSDEDRVLGLIGEQEAKAYPIRVLNWHEIVNDTLDGKPVLISYCPLCGTGMGFKRTIEGHLFTFGVSGLLYQSDVLMYDHQTESLWSQIAMKVITGTSLGKKLEPIFLEHTTWGAWKAAHPSSLVLSQETGHTRDYHHDPYSAYRQTNQLMFPAGLQSSQFHPKEWVLGVEVKGQYKAYPFSEMENIITPFQDTLNGKEFVVCWDPENTSAKAVDKKGAPIHSFMAYWFAWYAFHPDTDIFVHDLRKSKDPKINRPGLC